MQRVLLSGKIHTARLTGSEIDYEGSLEVDRDLIEVSGLLPYEKILVVNRSNGERLETYIIPGDRGSKVFCLNGPAAKRGNVGDVITIMGFGIFTEEEARDHDPPVIVLDADNNIIMRKGKIRERQ